MTTNHDNTDSLIDLLAAQCSDLEALLALARRESAAAESSDFPQLMTVVEDRATLGERLEIYHRQIAELRTLMNGTQTSAETAVAHEAARLAVEIQALDSKTTVLLSAARIKTGKEIARLDQGRRGFAAYLSDARGNGFRCDRHA